MLSSMNKQDLDKSIRSELKDTARQSGGVSAIQLFSCGLVSGILQAAIFNPWDRALYLSVKNSTRFLHPSNFTRPFEGLLQTVTQRAISAGLYFPLEQIFRDMLHDSFSSDPHLRPYINFLAGNLAGMSNGLLMNPFTTIKVI